MESNFNLILNGGVMLIISALAFFLKDWHSKINSKLDTISLGINTNNLTDEKLFGEIKLLKKEFELTSKDIQTHENKIAELAVKLNVVQSHIDSQLTKIHNDIKKLEYEHIQNCAKKN